MVALYRFERLLKGASIVVGFNTTTRESAMSQHFIYRRTQI